MLVSMSVMGMAANAARAASGSAEAPSASMSARNCVKYLPTGVSTSTVRYSEWKSSPSSSYARMVFITLALQAQQHTQRTHKRAAVLRDGGGAAFGRAHGD